MSSDPPFADPGLHIDVLLVLHGFVEMLPFSHVIMPPGIVSGVRLPATMPEARSRTAMIAWLFMRALLASCCRPLTEDADHSPTCSATRSCNSRMLALPFVLNSIEFGPDFST